MPVISSFAIVGTTSGAQELAGIFYKCTYSNTFFSNGEMYVNVPKTLAKENTESSKNDAKISLKFE